MPWTVLTALDCRYACEAMGRAWRCVRFAHLGAAGAPARPASTPGPDAKQATLMRVMPISALRAICRHWFYANTSGCALDVPGRRRFDVGITRRSGAARQPGSAVQRGRRPRHDGVDGAPRFTDRSRRHGTAPQRRRLSRDRPVARPRVLGDHAGLPAWRHADEETGDWIGQDRWMLPRASTDPTTNC